MPDNNEGKSDSSMLIIHQGAILWHHKQLAPTHILYVSLRWFLIASSSCDEDKHVMKMKCLCVRHCLMNRLHPCMTKTCTPDLV